MDAESRKGIPAYGAQILLLAMTEAPLNALKDPAAYRVRVTFTLPSGTEQSYEVHVFQAAAIVLPEWKET